jgi:branched-chain amino acid transport system permease protein
LELALAIFPQVVVDGIVLGFMYALIALGYTMVYGVLEFINFAHSEIFVLGAFVGVEVLLLLEAAGNLAVLHPAFVVVALLFAGMLVSGLAAVVLERVAYRPLRGAPRLVPLISAIGASFFLQDFIRLIESVWRNTFYLTYPSLDLLERTISFGAAVTVPFKSILVIATALLMLWALYLLVNRTKVGTAMRAVAQDPDTAALMGINVKRIIALTFFVGGSMGGVAGVLFGLHYSLINPYTGFMPGLKAFTAAVLGGIGNIPGAVLGGMVLGMMEALAASYLSILTGGAFGAEYKDVVAFLVLILILIFRPKGILGEKVREEGV